jgi:VanZ family protein
MADRRTEDRRHPPRRLAVTHWTPVVVCVATILAFTILPTVPPPPLGVQVSDKLAHAVAFAALAALGLRAARATWTHRVRAVAGCVAVACSIAVAGAIELIQRHVPGRSCDVADLAADLAGILLAGACVAIWARAASRPPR